LNELINRTEKFVDTARLTPAGNYYDKHGVYCPHPKGTKRYYEYWDEEKKRALYGYTTPEGDITITGYHYFYLNYCRIQIVKDIITPAGENLSIRESNWPHFYDSDYRYFHTIDYCRLNDKHIVVIKARRKGYSYKAASMLVRNYFLMKHSKNFVFAGMKEYLTGVDAILTKAWEMLNFIDDNTAWAQPRLLNGNMAKTSGYKKRVKGSFIDKGMLSSIAGVSLKDDPDKVRGKAGELIFFEEAGAFPGLLDAWGMAMPTMRQGSKTLGTMIAFGTGGTEGVGFESLNELFYQPKANDCLEVPNTWDVGGTDTVCGYFIPIFDALDGFIDPDGNSDIEGAIEFENKERENKRTANNATTYDKYLAEHPFTPQEATLQVSGNLFNLSMIKDQINRVKANNLQNLGTAGDLAPQPDGTVKFKLNGDNKPVYKFPHLAKDNVKGSVVVYEAPYKLEGKVPNLLYFICHDPYAHDKTSSNSLGAAYVIKRVNNMSQPDDMIVASYVGRPDTQDEYNRNLFNLATYYNAKIGFENDRGDVIGYAKRFRKLHYLQEEFQMLDKKELQSKAVKRNYGMHMTEGRKRQGELYIRDWTETSRGKSTDDVSSLNIHKIYDPALLEELLKFNQDGNFDRVMALMIGMFHDKELFNTAPEKQTINAERDSWFEGQYKDDKTNSTHVHTERDMVEDQIAKI
jgi:hypothetical protein